MNEKEIIEAYLFLRKNNHSISDETLEFMKIASLRELKDASKPWPIDKVLKQLIHALDILLGAFDYDGQGYEDLISARQAAYAAIRERN